MTDAQPSAAGPTRRLPIIATILVVVAVAVMIGLGFWQLQRRTEKLAALAVLAANPSKPPIAMPIPAIGDDLLFRRAGAMCLQPIDFSTEGAGNAGYRIIAHCKTGAEGPGFAVQIGTTRDVDFKPNWTGGKVSGLLSHAPSNRPLIAGLFSKAPPQPLLLVADKPAPGLSANGVPSIESIPNNHLAYAVQWFVFAAIALVIYGLALRRRARKE